MTTEFTFDNVFAAPSVESVLRAYFNADHLAAQDQVGDLTGREVVDEREDGQVKQTTWRVTSTKPLPVFARPFVDGGKLVYKETMTWRKAANAIDLTITPQILGGRVQVGALYTLSAAGDGAVKRRYQGSVSVDIRFLGGKIERAIVGEIEKGMPVMFKCTQNWLAANAS